MRAISLAVVAMLALSACGGGDKSLHNTSSLQSGPDEFSVLPYKPLEMPQSMALLPPPNPNGINLADPTPIADAMIALGGNPNGGIAGDAALIAQATRYGTDGTVRQTLASEDERYRWTRRNLGLFNIFAKDRYFSAYNGMALDPYAELERFGAAGVTVPSAPPQQ
ncbi:DUF3035 domain-containing protein [Marivivens donghaensis]|uniref:DUF3035 domain-containing protein n=1 Tax=Marivivens donghaensis TaxID=1699413 RepID=A0ABX0VVZ7_9RHOB|nr:DUF3035 domain-containing protein [Marivivens donghaensis]NIY71635.1 DUF3035 domain-containing protein [Marivivens donghaensis]